MRERPLSPTFADQSRVRDGREAAEAERRGLRVPRDLSVVGIDNLEIASHSAPPLTTVHLPTADLGRAVAEHLLARLCGEPRSRRTEMPIALIERRSSGPAPDIGRPDAEGRSRLEPR
ncbi:substrate-binding domain-containing protein [Methylobacterium amylolyticum]|uniref:substrate-binding domain-containing protein n=1 Tax=Methylobacterium sp. NEAU 140 TaxID=3064945 RepID=UPI0035200B55